MSLVVAEQESTRKQRSARRRTSVLPVVRRVHFYAGLFVAPLLALLCLTGLAFACTPQLDKLVYHHEFSLGRSPSGQALPLATQVAEARRAHPEGTLAAVQPPQGPEGTTGVQLRMPGLASGAERTVFVDPYTGHIRGVLRMTNGRPPLQQWVWTLHGTLHAGTVGRWYSETAASWLGILLLGGLALYWQRRRQAKRRRRVARRDGHERRGGEAARTARRLRPGRTLTRRVHTTLGLCLALGLAGLTVTGLTWSHYAGTHFEAVLDALHGHAPTLTEDHAATPGRGPVLSVDEVARIAHQQGLRPTTISYPSTPGGTFVVAESRDHWPVRRSSLAVDAHTGAVTARLSFADYPPLAKLSTLGIRLHEGLLFGLVNQIALAALAIGTLILLGSGYRMWWQRRSTRTRALAPPPARGAWRRLPPRALVLGIPLVLALGWLLPLFAVTLAGFLLLDTAVPRLRRAARGHGSTGEAAQRAG
ncbi:MAG: PepSY-associated TM helix domain-containing protein [Sciscionella sp.]